MLPQRLPLLLEVCDLGILDFGVEGKRMGFRKIHTCSVRPYVDNRNVVDTVLKDLMESCVMSHEMLSNYSLFNFDRDYAKKCHDLGMIVLVVGVGHDLAKM